MEPSELSGSLFLSSSTTENGASVSTPNRPNVRRPAILSIRVSPIPGQNALFRRSELNDTNFLSSSISPPNTIICHGDYTARSASINCLEIVKVRNFGYVNIQSTKVLSIVVRNRYEQVVMLATKLSGSEHDAFKVINNEDENRYVQSGSEILINVSFTPGKRTTYIRYLVVTVIPDRRTGLVPKSYEVCLVGHGGTAILRVSQGKDDLSSSKYQAKLVVRWDGQYDARMNSNRYASLLLKNNGERVAFVYIRALNRHGKDISTNRLSITPSVFLLDKLCFDLKLAEVQILDENLWRNLVHESEEVRLAIYSVVERQRMRLIEYAKLRNQRIDPIEDINFTSFNFGVDEKLSLNPETFSSEDVRVFKEELRVIFVRLLPPVETTNFTSLVRVI